MSAPETWPASCWAEVPQLRPDAAGGIVNFSRSLDHSSRAVTTTYLRRLGGQEDRGRNKAAKAIGVEIISGVG